MLLLSSFTFQLWSSILQYDAAELLCQFRLARCFGRTGPGTSTPHECLRHQSCLNADHRLHQPTSCHSRTRIWSSLHTESCIGHVQRLVKQCAQCCLQRLPKLTAHFHPPRLLYGRFSLVTLSSGYYLRLQAFKDAVPLSLKDHRLCHWHCAQQEICSLSRLNLWRHHEGYLRWQNLYQLRLRALFVEQQK